MLILSAGLGPEAFSLVAILPLPRGKSDHSSFMLIAAADVPESDILWKGLRKTLTGTIGLGLHDLDITNASLMHAPNSLCIVTDIY